MKIRITYEYEQDKKANCIRIARYKATDIKQALLLVTDFDKNKDVKILEVHIHT